MVVFHCWYRVLVDNEHDSKEHVRHVGRWSTETRFFGVRV